MRDDQKRLAFDLLYAEHATPLYRFALRLCGNREDAEDLAAEALLKAFRKGAKFRGDASARTWLFAIVVNEWRMLCRRRPHHKDHRLEDAEAMAETMRFDDLELAHALLKLSDVQREAFLLVKGEGFTHAEAGRISGVPEGTIASRVHEAIGKLRVALEDHKQSSPCEVTNR